MVLWHQNSASKTIAYSDFYQLLRQGKLREVVQEGDQYEGEVKDNAGLPEELQKKLSNGRFRVDPHTANAGMRSRANRRSCSVPPRVVRRRYSAPARLSASSCSAIRSGVS